MNIPSQTIIKILSIITGFVAILYIGYLVRTELIWIITAFSLALALNPLVGFIAKFIPVKSESVRRSLSIGVVFIGLIAAVVILAALFLPPLISQTQSFVRDIPHYYDQLLSPHSFSGGLIHKYNLVDRVKSSQGQLGSYASRAGGSAYGIVKAIFSSAIATGSILVFTIFMLNEGPTWRRRFWTFARLKDEARYQALATDMYRSVTAYVNGKLLMSLLAAIPTAVLLAILGVPYAIALGILVGLIDLIPLVGATIGAVIVLIVCLFSSLTAAFVMAIFFLIYQQVENHIFQPLIFGKSVEISSLIVLISILFGARIGGILGALIAIPVTASLQILLKDYLKMRPLRK
jgi:predicted PurR-regulated permease PerM